MLVIPVLVTGIQLATITNVRVSGALGPVDEPRDDFFVSNRERSHMGNQVIFFAGSENSTFRPARGVCSSVSKNSPFTRTNSTAAQR